MQHMNQYSNNNSNYQMNYMSNSQDYKSTFNLITNNLETQSINKQIQENQQSTIINPNNASQDIPRIRVIVRKRPLSKKELSRNDMDIIDLRSVSSLIVKELKTKVDMTKYIEEHAFNFDNVYGEDSTNEEIYVQTVRPMIEAAFKSKAKVTCFAYGQTGSGKTHTMMGPVNNSNGQVGIPGLYLLSGFDLFNFLSEPENQHLRVFISFYEIYCGKLHDLLNDRNLLQAREDGKGNICINGLQERELYSLNDLMKVIEVGLKSRTVGVTGANNDSSRSHAIIQISLKNTNNSTHGKISFIDLAGSERAQDTVDTNKQTRIDGAEINKSLLALKECIRALDQSKSHTPFRGSKLTLVLRDSFVGGNCKTLMIANVSPSMVCAENTLNTLRYADRVKELKKDKSDIKSSSTSNYNPEDLAKIMMMPRNHGNTVKYNVDKKMLNEGVISKIGGNSNSANSSANIHLTNMFSNKLNQVAMGLNNNNNEIKQKQVHSNFIGNKDSHVSDGFVVMENKNKNHIYQEDELSNKENNSKFPNVEILLKNNNSGYNNNCNNKATSNNNYDTFNVDNKRNIQHQNNFNNNQILNNNNNNNNNNKANTLDFLNNFNYYKNNNNKQQETNNLQINSQIEKLTKEHEKLIKEIISEEDKVVSNHRENIDSVVESIKLQMSFIGEVEEMGSDVNMYINKAENEITKEISKLQTVLNKFSYFKKLLNREKDISQQIINLSSGLTISNNNNNNNNNHNRNMNDNVSSSNCSSFKKLNLEDVSFNSFANNNSVVEFNNSNNNNAINSNKNQNITSFNNNRLNEQRYLNSQKKKDLSNNVNEANNNKNSCNNEYSEDNNSNNLINEFLSTCSNNYNPDIFYSDNKMSVENFNNIEEKDSNNYNINSIKSSNKYSN